MAGFVDLAPVAEASGVVASTALDVDLEGGRR